MSKVCLLLIMFVMVCSGCSQPYIMPTYPDKAKAERVMIPVGAVLDEVKTIDVILIHGMCTHDGFWALETNNRLLESLGFRKLVTKEELPPAIKGPFDQTVVYKFIRTEGGRTLRTYAILWSPATSCLKNTLCYDRFQGGPCVTEHNLWSRAAINGAVKSTLLDDCLADAVIYTGTNGMKLQNQVMDAVRYIVHDRSWDYSGKQSPPLFFIAESLGSKILFDAVARLMNEKDAAVNDAIGSTVQVFMEANQIPLLTLGNLGSDNGGNQADYSFNLFAGTRNRLVMEGGFRMLGQLPNPPKLTAVAFTDPNDLLSYTLQPSVVGRDREYEVLDVIVSNSATWLWLLENPYSAHTGYQKNPRVLRAIACGYRDAWENCQKEAE